MKKFLKRTQNLLAEKLYQYAWILEIIKQILNCMLILKHNVKIMPDLNNTKIQCYSQASFWSCGCTT